MIYELGYESFESLLKGLQTLRKKEKEKEDEKEHEDEQEIKKGWRDDFKIYLAECNEAYNALYNDSEFMAEQERLNPKIDVKLTIEKGYRNYWGTEAGWKKRKAAPTKEINWKRTIISSIDINKVWK